MSETKRWRRMFCDSFFTFCWFLITVSGYFVKLRRGSTKELVAYTLMGFIKDPDVTVYRKDGLGKAKKSFYLFGWLRYVTGFA